MAGNNGDAILESMKGDEAGNIYEGNNGNGQSNTSENIHADDFSTYALKGKNIDEILEDINKNREKFSKKRSPEESLNRLYSMIDISDIVDLGIGKSKAPLKINLNIIDRIKYFLSTDKSTAYENIAKNKLSDLNKETVTEAIIEYIISNYESLEEKIDKNIDKINASMMETFGRYQAAKQNASNYKLIGLTFNQKLEKIDEKIKSYIAKLRDNNNPEIHKKLIELKKMRKEVEFDIKKAYVDMKSEVSKIAILKNSYINLMTLYDSEMNKRSDIYSLKSILETHREKISNHMTMKENSINETDIKYQIEGTELLKGIVDSFTSEFSKYESKIGIGLINKLTPKTYLEAEEIDDLETPPGMQEFNKLYSSIDMIEL